ncbi:uncharacterized protein K460DRAFT_364270 [Cucurbitaria berberidis CBS 394.84]|uniref:Kinetochore protein mis14 n=1 Tax=Cucurbitaria berberidis CBS 394.84 TaxID=1168544 RepID=A0A9P4GN86_9PLEO|nr:uncharacterized protein K460DRAFT_364270 [Cucurbitaria berberidis CBS 394.84]KAF1848304.1 hypothetical protein K460DRAFT_364270 [Cucurbitaria berberidis CBS 394.84]
MESEQRKIELQSPGDLTFLTCQIRTAARQKLDLHLPPVSDSSEPDELRKHVEELVDAFVTQVLQGMRNNISINGIHVVARGREGDEVDEHGQKKKQEGDIAVEQNGVGDDESQVEKEDFEPFDDKLRTRLSTAVQKRDALIAKISQHRRATPAAAAAHFQAQFERESEALFRAQTDVDRAARVVSKESLATVQAIERADEVQRNWGRAVEGLGRLNKGLPETRARLERCGDVVGYLSGEGWK